MKKAEAISILATSVRPREPKDRARYDEAVKMAIEALRCSETPKSSERTSESAQNAQDEDLISRKAAIDCVTYDVEHTIECLKTLPSAQPEHPKGHWIVWGGMDIPENHGKHKCSVCGEFAPVRYEKPLIKEYLSDFCPNCGADMRGGDSE